MVFRDRLARLRGDLDLEDAVYLTSFGPHLYYFTGFTGGEGYLVVDLERVYLVVDGRYTTQAKDEVGKWVEVVEFGRGKLFDVLRELVRSRVYVEMGRISHRQFLTLKEKLDGVEEWLDADDVIRRLRMIKDDVEVREIRRMVDIAQRAFEEVLPLIKPGVRERDIAAELSYRMRKLGARRESFDIIVASGWRGALPHGTASDKVIEKGELVVVDWGAMDMYVSDLTRMVAVGEISDGAKQALKAVEEAQQAAIDAILEECPNVDCLERKAREILSGYGLEEFFTHSLGHGIGLEIHEPPRVGIGDGTEIESGLVFTVEPGVYIPGKFGVRIEDDVWIAGGRVEVLSSLPKIYEI